MFLVNTRGAPADKPHNHGNCTHIVIVVMLYLTFVFFFYKICNLQFEAKKFYTWKCVNSQQKLSYDNTVCKILHYV